MKKKKNKKIEKTVKKFPVFLYLSLALLVFLAAAVSIYFPQKNSDGIYVSSENPKQGDTVFVKVKSGANSLTGNFGNENLVFYKNNNSEEWFSFLGIDADQKPGDCQIVVSASKTEKLTKTLNVSLAGFTNAPAVAVLLKGQSATANADAVSNIRNNDNPAINKVISKITPAPYFTAPFSSPLGAMKKSGFSFGQFIGLGQTKIQHLGVDLSAAEDTEIYAVNDGKVEAILNLSNYGKTVIIDHGLGIFSMYLHLDKFKVSVGQMVKRGQDIGLSGETGYVSGPHLHFSMRVNGTRVDPTAFIQTTQQISGNSFVANVSKGFLNILK